MSDAIPRNSPQELRNAFRKIRRLATSTFENGVRLHEDSVLLFNHDRLPSSLLVSVLSIEEFGKYFMFEDAWFHGRINGWNDVSMIEEWMSNVFSHTSKQRKFSFQADLPFASKRLRELLNSGGLEVLKQKATYVSPARGRRGPDLSARANASVVASRGQTEELITFVNDYLLDLSLGVRKGFYGLDIPEIDEWLADPDFERGCIELWPKTHVFTRNRIEQMREHDDELREPYN